MSYHLSEEARQIVGDHKLASARPELLHVLRPTLGEALDAAEPAGQILVETRRQLWGPLYQHFEAHFNELVELIGGRRKDRFRRINLGLTYPEQGTGPDLFVGPFDSKELTPRLQTAATTYALHDETVGMAYVFDDDVLWREEYTTIWAESGNRLNQMAAGGLETIYVIGLLAVKLDQFQPPPEVPTDLEAQDEAQGIEV